MIFAITNEHDTITVGGPVVIDTGDNLGPARVYATGGAKYFQLPDFCKHLEIAPAGSKSVAVRVRDLIQREAGGHGTFTGSERLNQLIIAGIISVVVTAQTAENMLDIEEAAIAEI